MPEKGKVLVIEDDADLRGLYRTTLTIAGFDVAQAGNGLEALRRLEATVPNLIVLDMGLPNLSGRAFLLELTAQARTRKIPVVVVTGSSRSFKSLNVACVLRKPVAPEELLDVVDQVLTQGEGFASLSRS